MGIKLQANAKTENKAWSDKPPFTANHVSHREREKRAKESSGRENGYLLKQSNHSDEIMVFRSATTERMTNHKTFAVSWEEMVGSSDTGG